MNPCHYYRDANSHFEGVQDRPVRRDHGTRSGPVGKGHDVPAVRDGRIIKDGFTDGLPKELNAFVFNTRKPIFADAACASPRTPARCRMDQIHTFFFDRFRRNGSYFDDQLSARGRPANARERELLGPFPGAVRADVLEGTWAPPLSDRSGRDRETLKRALTLLNAAGYALNGAVLRERSTGKPFSFEILVTTRDQERLAIAFQRAFERAGIEARLRVVDAVQYDRRRISHDFAMIQNRWYQSLSPGNEQIFHCGLAAADAPSHATTGAKSPPSWHDLDHAGGTARRFHRRRPCSTAC